MEIIIHFKILTLARYNAAHLTLQSAPQDGHLLSFTFKVYNQWTKICRQSFY